MIKTMKSFVTSDVCLDCDGCCRFKEQDSDWRARISLQEEVDAMNNQLAEEVFSKNPVDDQRYIKTQEVHDCHQCSFLEADTNKCQIYSERPFECQLYPFVLSKNDKGSVDCFAHLSCPFIQDKLGTGEYDAYINYLKDFFQQEEVFQHLNHNSLMISNYQKYERELSRVFSIDQIKRTNLEEERAQIEQTLKTHQWPLAQVSLVNVFAWQNHFDFLFKDFNETKCLFAYHHTGCFCYWPPLGDCSQEVIEECFKDMEAVNPNVARIENVPLSILHYFDHQQYEWVQRTEVGYRRENIEKLEGQEVKSKRNDLNFFNKNYEAKFEVLTPDLTDECLALFDKWAYDRKSKSNDDLFHTLLAENRQILAHLLQHYSQLPLVGRVVLINEKIEAFTLGYAINDQTFCVLFEIVNLDFRGLSVFIFQQFCLDDEVKSFELINVMDSFGLENIERTKQMFQPTVSIPTYTVTRRKEH